MGKRVESRRVGEHDELARPGDFHFYVRHGDQEPQKIAGMIYLCPCGCGEVSAVGFRGLTDPPRPSWEWDGNEDKPTLAPSIQRREGCRWHGFLRAGVFEEC